jgi:hypothetical protein
MGANEFLCPSPPAPRVDGFAPADRGERDF